MTVQSSANIVQKWYFYTTQILFVQQHERLNNVYMHHSYNEKSVCQFCVFIRTNMYVYSFSQTFLQWFFRRMDQKGQFQNIRSKMQNLVLFRNPLILHHLNLIHESYLIAKKNSLIMSNIICNVSQFIIFEACYAGFGLLLCVMLRWSYLLCTLWFVGQICPLKSQS